jgi:hypothetical protein
MNTEQTTAVHVQTLRAGMFNGEMVDVDVYELCTGLNVADLRGFEIRTSTGYRAIFPEAHIAGDTCTRDICLKPYGHDNACKGCHGTFHLDQVLVTARMIAKTYGAAEKGRTDASAGRPAGYRGITGQRVEKLSPAQWADTDWARTMEALVG